MGSADSAGPVGRVGRVGRVGPVFIPAPSRVVDGEGIRIDEHFGAVCTGEGGMSLARLRVEPGWSEPRQRPEFDEYTLVLAGVLRVEFEGGALDIRSGEAVMTRRGEWVRYSSPQGADYVAVCVPAFTPRGANREES